ncbi:lytic transglycosylase domain-containing protein [Pseudobdellovibrio exovorus]|uniref:Soluble lytic murein transglycosylase n=1 Tax=Pseudobdellovibrio exovorus JSS TaxID=1184267 RepID=M4V8X6_9BACT|nr:lytic transglycosylase domain-containing protein [Pseudobdellovibrio exovorus]AGH95857.1 soluble lytic murein transglycosylase [Pseudobdellovibrio exovorus JSS]
MRPVLPVIFMLLFSVSTPSLIYAQSSDDVPVLLSMKCDDLIEKAKEDSFALKTLAAIRALSRCADFTFDLSKISALERQLYSAEIKPLEASPEQILTALLTADDIAKKIKTEKEAATKYELYKQLRLQHRKTGNKTAAQKASTELHQWALQYYKKHKKEPIAYTALYEGSQLAVRDLWTAGNTKEAQTIINAALGQLQKTHSVAELLFLKGRIAEESKQSKIAVTQYTLTEEDIKKHNPKGLSFNTDRLLWLKAWILYKDKNFEEAEQAFAHLVNSTQDSSERSRALFFQARCLKQLDQQVQYKILMESIPDQDFFGYYSLVSYHELGKKLPALKDIKPEYSLRYDLKLNFLSSENRQLFKDLLKYKEFALAEKASGLLAATPNEEMNMALYLAKNHDIFLPIFRSFSRLNNNEKIDLFMNYPELIFPQLHKSQVNEMAKKTELPASLIYAIIKQESAFNPKARSGANALGLMQVIPNLAQQLAKKFDVPYSKAEDLYNPKINIPLGSYELMEQVKKQNGQLTYVAAAYNAGPNALAGWLKNRNRDDILEFIEEIPYEETRTYVKLIARNQLFYQRISNRDKEQSFPSEFLNN